MLFRVISEGLHAGGHQIYFSMQPKSPKVALPLYGKRHCSDGIIPPGDVAPTTAQC